MHLFYTLIYFLIYLTVYLICFRKMHYDQNEIHNKLY